MLIYKIPQDIQQNHSQNPRCNWYAGLVDLSRYEKFSRHQVETKEHIIDEVLLIYLFLQLIVRKYQ